MKKKSEKTGTPNVVAVVQRQTEVSESNGNNRNQSENTLQAERAAMRSAIVDFPHYGTHIAEQHPLRILIAEDSMVNMKIALWFLKKLGYHPDVAFNGIEVLDALKRRYYDVIFMDAEMPEMDGCEATISIRNTLPISLQPHIIAMSANDAESNREKYLSIGMNDYITKPLKIEELVQVLIAARPLPIVSKLSFAVENEQSLQAVA